MRLTSSSAVEYRFALIVKLATEGKRQCAIAELVGCSQGWVCQVLKRHREAGGKALSVKPHAGGTPRRLSEVQLATLKEELQKGALCFGFPTPNWTRQRIADFIVGHFAVRYHPAHISRLMRRIGFTVQKPRQKSYRQDAAAVSAWRQRTLPDIKKSGPPRQAHSL